MRVKVDIASDALYFRLDESKIVESEEVRPGVILDFDENDQVVGEAEMMDLEVACFSDPTTHPSSPKTLWFECTSCPTGPLTAKSTRPTPRLSGLLEHPVSIQPSFPQGVPPNL